MTRSTKIGHELEIESTSRWVFRLSYFLLADRRDALSVLHQATSRLYVTALTQKKRQAKRPKKEVHKKLSLTPRQLLQYLTYLCAEPYEGMQEQEHRDGARTLTLEDMIIRYVKHLMLLYLEHNSFYATVGQSCVLFDLSTRQAEQLYEMLVQGSPAHLDTKGDYSVRDAKREIRQRLGRRFEDFLTSYEGARREQMFVTMGDPGPHFRFVKRCLHRLQPVEGDDGHSRRWHLPAHFDPRAYDLVELQYDEMSADPRAEQAAEARRLHAVTHPCCWARLLRASCHSYSRQRVVLPEFKLNRQGAADHMPPPDRHNPPELIPAEMKSLAEMLQGEARRRKGLFAPRLSVSVDGSTRCSWDIYRQSALSVQVEPGARVLEVGARDDEGELLLAQYLVGLGGASDEGGRGAVAVTLESGQEFTFTPSRPTHAGEGPLVTIRFRETRPDRALAGYLVGRYAWLRGLARAGLLTPRKVRVGAAFAALVLLLLTGWWVAGTLTRPHQSPVAGLGGSAPPTPPGPSAAPSPPLEPSGQSAGSGGLDQGEGAPTTTKPSGGEPAANPLRTPRGRKSGAARPPGFSPNIILALRDGDRLVTLDARGRYTGLEGLPHSWRRKVGETLLAQRVERPPVLDALGDGAGGEMRGHAEGVPFEIIGPTRAVIESDRPLFRWGALRGATSYAVAVFDRRLNMVARSGPLAATEWTPPSQLPRGEVYLWQVTAVLDGKEVVSPGASAPEAKFAVVGQAESEALRHARLSLPGRHLTLGVLYARAGLLEQAESEFRALVESNPKSPAALKLLRSVREMRARRRVID
ncbi:MAG TPA: hypothetical protein VN282_24265 [Pyrinomonadaceae bacterium]|nr:hypothetical protein [Pyrinomonadaceae bacterium]